MSALTALVLLSLAPPHISLKWIIAGRSEKVAPHLSDLNQAGSCYCGVVNEEESDRYSDRVVGGSSSLQGQFPWQVALVRDQDPSLQFCGGSLVTNRHVLTAAHCTVDLSPSSIGVIVGLTNLSLSDSQAGAVLAVKEIINHPDYRGSQTKYADDISVLVLSEVVDLHSSALIKPVCLPVPSGSSKSYTGQPAVVTGWGLTDYYNGTFPHHLQHVAVTVLGRKCGQLSQYLTDSQICAGHPEGGRDACQGDSGGPLVTRDQDNNQAMTVIGVVSAGSVCGHSDFPGIYTDVQRYTAQDGWLTKQLSGSQSCPPPPQTSDNIVVRTTTATTAQTSAGALQGQAVIIIGGTGYAREKKVEVWSPSGSCRKTLADLPDFRSNHDSDLLNGVPTVCGGDRTLKSCLRLNSNNEWETTFKTKGYRSRHTMVSYGTGLLIMGGRWTASVEYAHNHKSVLLEGKVPRMESSCSVLTDRNTIITTGGVAAARQAWEFDLVTGDWLELAEVPDGGRYKHSCTFLSNSGLRGVLVVGGSDGLQLHSSTLFYDLDKQAWFTLPDLPQKRWGSRLVNLNGRIFVIGGGEGREYVEDVYELDLIKWTWVGTSQGILYPRSDFSVVVVDEEYLGCEDLVDVINPK